MQRTCVLTNPSHSCASMAQAWLRYSIRNNAPDLTGLFALMDSDYWKTTGGEGAASTTALPAAGFRITSTLDYGNMLWSVVLPDVCRRSVGYYYVTQKGSAAMAYRHAMAMIVTTARVVFCEPNAGIYDLPNVTHEINELVDALVAVRHGASAARDLKFYRVVLPTVGVSIGTHRGNPATTS